jgi:hypothetical protein
MTFPRFFAMCEYWRTHPSLRDMVQAYLGIKIGPAKDSPKQASQNSPQDLHEFMKMFAAAGGRTG